METSIIDKVEAEIAIDEAKLKKNKKIKEMIIYGIIILVLVIEAVILCNQLYNRFVPDLKYDQAIEYYNAENYKEALKLFKKLDDHKNSKYYCELICAENPLLQFEDCKIGDEITFGKYNYEDIEWVVYRISADSVEMISKYIIDADACPEYEWFKKFESSSFFGKEKYLVDDTFLLSDDDAEDYLTGKNFAKTQPTRYALSKEGFYKGEYGYGWWLSTTGVNTSTHRVCGDDGTVGYNTKTKTEVCGIRPAIIIDLGALEELYAENNASADDVTPSEDTATPEDVSLLEEMSMLEEMSEVEDLSEPESVLS